MCAVLLMLPDERGADVNYMTHIIKFPYLIKNPVSLVSRSFQLVSLRNRLIFKKLLI